MSPGPRKLEELDLGVPFIAAVRRVERGEADIREAALILRANMERFGVFVLGPFEWLWGAVPEAGCLLDENEGLRLSELLRTFARLVSTDDAVAREAELQRSFEERYALVADLESHEEDKLFPFLSATLMLIEGTAFTNDMVVMVGQSGSADPTIVEFGGAWSQRGWGTTLAQWAKWAGWVHASGRELTYVDFYIGAAGGVPNYTRFVSIARAAIAEVTRQLWAEASLPAQLFAAGLRE